ncbi:MAG: hypothetical protein ABI234_08425 [Ktedonobacteraceae bacterium]
MYGIFHKVRGFLTTQFDQTGVGLIDGGLPGRDECMTRYTG